MSKESLPDSNRRDFLAATGTLSAGLIVANAADDPPAAPADKKLGPIPTTARAGGETHQTASADRPVLTTQQGVPVADDQNTLRAGPRGPALMEDFHFRPVFFIQDPQPGAAVLHQSDGSRTGSHRRRSGLRAE